MSILLFHLKDRRATRGGEIKEQPQRDMEYTIKARVKPDPQHSGICPTSDLVLPSQSVSSM